MFDNRLIAEHNDSIDHQLLPPPYSASVLLLDTSFEIPQLETPQIQQ